jgi:hypothetical protein
MVALAKRARGVDNPNRAPYMVQNIVDFAEAVTTKGSALAQGDVIQALSIPANSLILSGGLQVVTEHTGTSTDLTLDVGFTGGDVDAFVDGFDYDAAAVGAHATSVVANFPQHLNVADTVDILLTTMTGTTTGGKVRVWAWIAEYSDVGDKYGGVAARDTSL